MKNTLLMMVAAVATTALEASDIRSDAVISFRANAMQDLNNNGMLDVGTELLDCIDPVNTGNGKYARYRTGAKFQLYFQNEDVRYHSFPGTNNEQVIWFKQPMTEVSRDEGKGTITYEYSPNEIWISSLGNEFGTSYTAYTKVRLDPRNALKDNKEWIFNLGHNDSKGLMVGLGGAGATRSLQILVNTIYVDEPIAVAANEWLDIAVSVEGPAEGTTGDVTIRVVVYQDNHISFAKTYTSAITSTAKTTKPSTQLLLGAEANNDGNKTYQTTYKTDGTYVSSTANNCACCFIGSLSELTLWNRALSIEEMQNLIRMRDGKLWQVGVKNGKSTEFTAATAKTDTVEPLGVWSTSKPTLAAGEKMDITFPVRDTMAGQAVLFSYATAEDSGAGSLHVTVNGNSIGEKAVPAGVQTVSFFVPKAVLKEGEGNLLRIERTDANGSAIRLDSCWMGGAWHLGYADKSFDEFCHEGSNWADYYIDDYRFNRLRRVMLDSGNNNVDRIHFRVLEEALTDEFHWDLKIHFGGGATDNTDISIKLNDQLLERRVGKSAVDNALLTYRLPSSVLTSGENVLELKNNASVAGGYASLDYIWLTLEQKKGMMLIFK